MYKRQAYNGIEALDHALNPGLKLIIMDVMMPKLDGLSAVIKIREQRNIPIIVLSAKSEETDKILGLSMGADDYVTKPFSPAEPVSYTHLDVYKRQRLPRRHTRVPAQPRPPHLPDAGSENTVTPRWGC